MVFDGWQYSLIVYGLKQKENMIILCEQMLGNLL